MFKYDFFSKKKYIIFTLLLIISASIFSIFFYQYVYDGHHHGLMFSNAVDLIDSKKPYKEIFIQYGLLTTIIHAISLQIFGKFIFSLHLITIIFYAFSLFFIFLIIKKITNEKYAFLAIFAVVANHAIPSLPWSNYIAFFFITLGIVFFVYKNVYSYYLTGLFLSLSILSRQDYAIPLFFALIIYIPIYLFFEKSLSKTKNISGLLLGFLFPLIIFLAYLFYDGLLDRWLDYLLLPSFYLEANKSTINQYLFYFINFFLTKAFFNFINTPQYLLILMILFSNTFLLIKLLIEKNLDYLFIIILSLTLCAIGISTELFRLYTSVSLGVVGFFYFIYNLKSAEIKKFLCFLIVCTSFFSLIFYPTGNNDNFKKVIFSAQAMNPTSKIFKFQKWLPHHANALNKIADIRRNVLGNCNIQFGDNFTFDNYFANLLELDRVKLIPSVKANTRFAPFDVYFNNNFVPKINNLIQKENIILLISENNYSFPSGTITFNEKYTFQAIKLNSPDEKPLSLRFYYPKNCFTKS